MNISGYMRENGEVGFRKHLLVLSTSVCASETAVSIASSIEGAVAPYNQHGCCQLGADLEVTTRTFIGIGRNPNIAGVLVVGLGCESISTERVADAIAETGKSAETVIIQEAGGTLKATEEGTRKAQQMAETIAREKRTKVDVSDVTLAMECGGSDTTSGLAANPVAGYVADKVVDLGGTVLLSETTELIGAEHLLAKRAISKEVAKELIDVVKRTEDRARALGIDMLGGQPTRGNIEGGLSTIEEKSLGAILKGGTRELKGVLEYATKPRGKGLYFMDTPGQDIESITGMTAGGSQAVIFTTGRGTPTGSPITPVIKVTANKSTYARMPDNLDFDSSGVIEGSETIKETGDRLFRKLIETLDGGSTKAETLKHREFGIYKLASTF